MSSLVYNKTKTSFHRNEDKTDKTVTVLTSQFFIAICLLRMKTMGKTWNEGLPWPKPHIIFQGHIGASRLFYGLLRTT
jgi:hypothetical protein